MKNVFRSVDFWKSAIMTMPDNSFYELIRSVFGKIKTPFNKQQLLKDLEVFLLREDIQKAIAEYIDENDAKIIAATALFGEPVPGELESFFSGEFSFLQLQEKIVNLEERFILYLFKEENTNRIALNPVLEQVLAPVAADTAALFPPVTEAGNTAGFTQSPAVLNDRILAALLSFASQWESFFRAEGVIRRQVIEAGKVHFPGIDLDEILCSLQILGLFYADGDKLIPDKKYFDDFSRLNARERMEYCTAAILVYTESRKTAGQSDRENLLPPLYRNRIREATNFICCFLNSFDTKPLYTDRTLKRLIEILKAKTGIKMKSGMLMEAMEKTGLIVQVSPGQKQIGAIVNNAQSNSSGAVIAIDSGSSILVYPEINFTDLIRIAAFLNIKETGAVVRFELEKDSAVRSFDSNTGADEIIEMLKHLSGGRIDDTLVWNLKEWERRHSEVSLKKGVILTLSKDHRYLAETMPLSAMIREAPAPGVYLLDENAIDEAAAVLQNAGIDIIARSAGNGSAAISGAASGTYSTASSKKDMIATAYNYFPPVKSDSHLFVFTSQPVKRGDSHLLSRFHEILEKTKMGEAERAELSARIDRRLVLCETQLKDANVRYEKLEARHMDYAGKQNVAKQAVTQQSPVEITWLSAGEEKNIFGIPAALEKEEGELILAIVPAGNTSENSCEETLRIPLAKMSLIRRIKKSIFT